MIMVVYSCPQQIIDTSFNPAYVKFWRKWIQMHKTKYIDCFPYVLSGKSATEKQLIANEYFIGDDIHWNLKGHKQMADILLQQP